MSRYPVSSEHVLVLRYYLVFLAPVPIRDDLLFQCFKLDLPIGLNRRKQQVKVVLKRFVELVLN